MAKNRDRRKALAKKFPEMDQRFQQVMEGVDDPPIEHVGESKKKKRR